jgi:hypothetical protein
MAKCMRYIDMAEGVANSFDFRDGLGEVRGIK